MVKVVCTEMHVIKRVMELGAGEIECILIDHMRRLEGMKPMFKEMNPGVHHDLKWTAPGGYPGDVTITITQQTEVRRMPKPARKASRAA
jgi:hypothetical protein